MNPLIFIHIPKTAGTSIRVAAQNYFGTESCLFDYGVGENSSHLVNKLNNREITMKDFWGEVHLRKISFIAGHFEALKYIEGDKNKNFFTMLRDPISRIVSEYNHVRKHNNYAFDFCEFYRSSEQINRQTQLLNGLDSDTNIVYGISEFYAESLLLINKKFGTNFAQLVENRTQDFFIDIDAIPHEVLGEMIELNSKDISLYKHSLASLRKRIFFKSERKTNESLRIEKNDLIKNSNFKLESLRRNNKFAHETLQTGWKIQSIIEIENKLKILLLKHDSFGEGVWYFNSDDNFIGNQASLLSQGNTDFQDSIRLLIKRIIRECIEPKSCQPQIINLLGKGLLSELSLIAFNVFECQNISSSSEHSLECQFLRSTPKDVQDPVLKASSPSMNLNLPGCSLKAIRGIVVNDYIIAYPLYENENFDSILFTGGHEGSHIAILKFNENKFYFVNNHLFDPNILNELLLHINVFWQSIRVYFDQVPPSNIIGITRSSHIGHRLWNDVSGLFRVSQHSSVNTLKSIVHYDHFGIGEIWVGARDVLNQPELNIQFAGYDNKPLAEIVYSDGSFPLRIGDRFIPKHLVDFISSSSALSSDNIIHKKIESRLVVVFGLRFENRTWINQLEGLGELAYYLSEKTDSLTIVVDGHDRVGSNKIRSHGENSNTCEIIQKEKNALLYIKEYLIARQKHNVNVIDAVDINLCQSILLVQQADFFIAPWGAGLAKYKWFANLDGLILASNFVKANKPDLFIYEDPNIREGATQCHYLDSIYVEDLNDAGSAIELPDRESRGNFKVDVIGAKYVIDKLLAKINKPLFSSDLLNSSNK